MSKERVLLVGYGDIASRLAVQLAKKDYHLEALRRSSSTQDNGISLHQADCRDLSKVQQIIGTGFDVIVMTMVPTEMSDQGYKAGYIDTVNTVLKALTNTYHLPRLLLFVSSTSVYGQQDASWINEASPTEPSSYSGKRLLEAEQLLKDYQQKYKQAICCVRFSGIYGPGRRRLIDQVIAGKGTPAEPVLYSNRIHADDCAGVLTHIIEQQKIQPIAPLYLATDCQPVPLYEVKQWIAKILELPKNHLKNSTELTPARMLRSSKRCSNRRLLEAGYEFLYPTFKEGYQKLLEESE